MVNKIKNIKEKTKNKIGDQQLVEILNSVKKKPNVKEWTVDDVKTLFQKIICTLMIIVALFIISKTWKHPKCPQQLSG